MKKTLKILTILGIFFTTPAFARPYEIDHKASKVQFSGTHAGESFQGVFNRWSAKIDFDPASLNTSRIDVDFDPASAVTGKMLFDGTLPQVDWFNVKQFPNARFVSTNIARKDDGKYIMTGDLTLRGITYSVTFPFSLSDLAVSPIKVTAKLPIDRLSFDIGKKSDPGAEWVSATIEVTVDLIAH